MISYWLAADAYVAVLGPQTVFFNLRQRSFCALRTSWIYSLRTAIEEWGMPEATYNEEDANAPVTDYAAHLANRGLLTTVRAVGKRMEQLQFEPARQSLVEQAGISEISVGFVKAARIIYSGMAAVWRFRHRTLQQLLMELDTGRRAGSQSRPLSAQEISHLVCAYWRFRPLLPFDQYTDLIDSLTLIEYLSKYFVFPRLVIGVKLMPFATHSWVQEGTTVFNDSPEFVGQFTPIFST